MQLCDPFDIAIPFLCDTPGIMAGPAVEKAYERGKAVNTAPHFALDDVIGSMDSRRWITNALRSAPRPKEAPLHRHVVRAARSLPGILRGR